MSILSLTTFLLDIETSGLSREKDQIISIGLLYEKEHTLQKDHRFIEDLADEKNVLEDFLRWCQNYETIVSFRGNGFDLPFLLARMKYHQLDESPFLKLKFIDTEKILKAFSSKRQELEKMLGIKRHSTSTGQDIAHLYRTYVSCKEPLYKKLILQHQEDELVSLYGIWELYQTLYHLKTQKIITYKIEKDLLSVTYTYAEPFSTSFHASAYNYMYHYEKGQTSFTLTCRLVDRKLKHFLTPVKDYYYIESEGQLMHKSLAAFVPASMKRKAKKEECYIEASHTFLPIASTYQLSQKIWQDETQQCYIVWEESALTVLAQQVFSLFFHQK